MDPHATFTQIRELKLTADALKKAIFEVKNGEMAAIVSGELKLVELRLPKKLTATTAKELQTVINRAFKKAQDHIKKAVTQLTR